MPASSPSGGQPSAPPVHNGIAVYARCFRPSARSVAPSTSAGSSATVASPSLRSLTCLRLHPPGAGPFQLRVQRHRRSPLDASRPRYDHARLPRARVHRPLRHRLLCAQCQCLCLHPPGADSLQLVYDDIDVYRSTGHVLDIITRAYLEHGLTDHSGIAFYALNVNACGSTSGGRLSPARVR